MTTRPNFIVFHWHDVGRRVAPYEDHGFTPNLESLVRDSIVFERAFCTAPLCSPARGSLFTGRYPHRNGLMGLAHLGWGYNPGERTIAHIMSEGGYHTALIGLQHESADPTDLGFEEIIQTPPDEPEHCGPVAELAEGFLSQQARADRPFFASIGFWEVHRPYASERYTPAPTKNVRVPPYLRDTEEVRSDLAGFFGAMRDADCAAGVIFQALAATGLDRSTWLFFTTDHGEAFPGAKATLYDPGLRVALLVRPPTGWNNGASVVPNMVSHLDVAPTILDLAGLSIPDNIDGVSLARLMRGDDQLTRRAVFGQQNWHDPDMYDPMRCIRTDDFKYILNFLPDVARRLPGDIAVAPSVDGMAPGFLGTRPSEELYDLRVDPNETTNVADRPEYQEVKLQLRAELERWRRETGDPLLDGPIPGP